MVTIGGEGRVPSVCVPDLDCRCPTRIGPIAKPQPAVEGGGAAGCGCDADRLVGQDGVGQGGSAAITDIEPTAVAASVVGEGVCKRSGGERRRPLA